MNTGDPIGQGAPIRRIMVYGVTGSGKTTLARRIGERTGVPWHAVDDLTWQPDWVPVPKDEQRRLIEELCAGDSWVLDHGYGAWLDVVLRRVQLIVALDYSRPLSLGRLVRRSVINVVTRRPTCNGNLETWRALLARDSILRWHFKSFSGKRNRIRGWATDPDGPSMIVFRRPADAERWLRGLGA
jgi:adenylate kinase family enzyme